MIEVVVTLIPGESNRAFLAKFGSVPEVLGGQPVSKSSSNLSLVFQVAFLLAGTVKASCQKHKGPFYFCDSNKHFPNVLWRIL